MNGYKVIGVMSGTSLDGLDMACCTLSFDQAWSYELGPAVTVGYTAHWKDRLERAMMCPAEALARMHADYGRFIGEQVRQFMISTRFRPDYIASHGHTVFHRPQHGFTLQVGDGNGIAAVTGVPVIHDFRSLDVALGGQGAPLVPAGDRLLFGDFGVCLNIGGIANLSYESGDTRIAFDICPANMLLNFLSAAEGERYDRDGLMASRGRVDNGLLECLNSLDYYGKEGSKSLGREWFLSDMVPCLRQRALTGNDLLRTAVEHIAMQVAASLPDMPGKGILVTGGGAHNRFLVDRIRHHVKMDVIVPGKDLVDYKEALVFALLGVLRARGEVNCLASVTGAARDSCGGVMTA